MISKYFKTFSGTDTLVFILFPNSSPILLGSITTVSYSIFRDKAPVNIIGRVNVAGITRGNRVVAGSLIFTMISQNWVNELMDNIPELAKYETLKADEIPIFDLMIVSANEYGSAIQGYIYGVDVTEDGQVVSVEDMFTENINKFVARDIDLFKEDKRAGKKLNNSRVMVGYNRNFDNSIVLNRSNRDLEVIQDKLLSKGFKGNFTNSFDETLINTIRNFQKINGLEETGYVDNKTYKILFNEENKEYLSNKMNVPLYIKKDCNSPIVRYLEYFENIPKLEEEFTFYDEGYIYSKDVFVIPPYTIEKSHDLKDIQATILECIEGDIFFRIRDITIDTQFKVSTIVKYRNGRKDNFTRSYFIKKNTVKTISTRLFNDSFVYSPTINSEPLEVEFIIAPNGYEPMKYFIKLVEV